MCIYVCVYIFIYNIKIFFEIGTLFSLGWPRTVDFSCLSCLSVGVTDRCTLILVRELVFKLRRVFKI